MALVVKLELAAFLTGLAAPASLAVGFQKVVHLGWIPESGATTYRVPRSAPVFNPQECTVDTAAARADGPVSNRVATDGG